MNLIKLSDFARQNGVTPRAVQQLLKKYESEIEGHFERKGQNGTWLDGTAQDFLRSKMLQKPIVTYDVTAQPLLEENETLKVKVSDLQDALAAAYKLLADERKHVSEAQLKLQSELVKLQFLEAAKGAAEEKIEKLENDLKTAEDVAEATGQELEKTKAALEQEKNRSITFKEWWRRRK